MGQKDAVVWVIAAAFISNCPATTSSLFHGIPVRFQNQIGYTIPAEKLHRVSPDEIAYNKSTVSVLLCVPSPPTKEAQTA
ncbi:hypothetical protein JOB18_010485 [Solea senegalensis]|uniref:Uncharacterized protein n=1 Tax=Solea senegalensis TaxID=28829 RepID=A0AAV6SNA4_SOLSE|nr:hypothetical protein JOB18_010485 [Solea senegalensis]